MHAEQIGFIKFGSQVLQNENSISSFDGFNPYIKIEQSFT